MIQVILGLATGSSYAAVLSMISSSQRSWELPLLAEVVIVRLDHRCQAIVQLTDARDTVSRRGRS
jgi:hypothetical protein